MTNFKDNPGGCVDPQRRGGRSCIECYYAQINERKQWTGNERCWDALCIVEERKDK